VTDLQIESAKLLAMFDEHEANTERRRREMSAACDELIGAISDVEIAIV
jgi:hypothetical protein